VNKTTTCGTVNNIPGEPAKCWITSNLGSDHQATAVNDNTEPLAGWYCQFPCTASEIFETENSGALVLFFQNKSQRHKVIPV
jgi:hypothetical protein